MMRAQTLNSTFIAFAVIALLVSMPPRALAEDKDAIWSGTITIETTTRYDCEIEPTKETEWRSLKEHNHIFSRAEIHISRTRIYIRPDDIYHPRSGLEVSGMVEYESDYSKRSGLEPKSTYCLPPKKRDVSPGSWIIDKVTHKESATWPITTRRLRFSVRQDHKATREDKVNDDKARKVHLSVFVTNSPGSMGTLWFYREEYDACSGKKTIERNETTTTQSDHCPTDLSLDFSGTYTKGKDGKDQITGSHSKTWIRSYNKEFNGKKYPMCITTRCTVNLIRQPGKPLSVKVQEVHFNYGENQTLNRVITLKRHKDDSEIKCPEWTRDGKREPAAFVRGYQFKVKAKFEADKNVEWAKISAEEETNEGGGFGGIKEKKVEFEDGKGKGEFDINNAQQVVGVNKVKWKWKATVKYKDEDKPKDMELDSTEHTIYIVGGNPVEDADPYVYVVKKGCEWAEGTKGGDETFKKIWDAEEFRGLHVPCPNETPCPQNFPPYMIPGVLAYRGPATKTTESLLNSGRGSCGAWQDFFYDVVGCQGIKVKKVDMKPKSEMGFDRLVVKKISAQGVPMPHRVFKEHAIIEYNNNFYDPSYHFITNNDLHEYENQTYEAYCDSDKVSTSRICEELYDDNMEPVQYERFTQCLVEQNPGCKKNDKTKCEVRPR